MKHKSKARRTKSARKKKERKKIKRREKTKGETTAIVFGHKINPKKIQDAAYDALKKREYTTDDIHVKDFIECEEENENLKDLMIKIALLDHIEEQLRQRHPKAKVERKNKLTIQIR